MNARFSKILWCFLSIVAGIIFIGCSKDDDDQLNNIVGTWYGTRTYYNPVGGTKYQYLTFRFYDNYTGEYDYESPVSYEKGYFSYQIKGGLIVCKGATANTYGDVDADFVINLKIDADRLLPQEKYSVFILTRDGSVVTDGNGNEIRNEEADENKNPSNTEERARIQKLIGEHVSVAASYSFYYWKFVIKSNLSKYLSNKTIKYGVGHAQDNQDPVITYSPNGDGFAYSEKEVEDGLEITINNPFWGYYFFTIDPADSSTGVKCDMYYKSLCNMNSRPLESFEIEMRDNLINLLNKYESPTKWGYTPSIWIKVGDEAFKVATYMRK